MSTEKETMLASFCGFHEIKLGDEHVEVDFGHRPRIPPGTFVRTTATSRYIFKYLGSIVDNEKDEEIGDGIELDVDHVADVGTKEDFETKKKAVLVCQLHIRKRFLVDHDVPFSYPHCKVDGVKSPVACPYIVKVNPQTICSIVLCLQHQETCPRSFSVGGMDTFFRLDHRLHVPKGRVGHTITLSLKGEEETMLDWLTGAFGRDIVARKEKPVDTKTELHIPNNNTYALWPSSFPDRMVQTFVLLKEAFQELLSGDSDECGIRSKKFPLEVNDWQYLLLQFQKYGSDCPRVQTGHVAVVSSHFSHRCFTYTTTQEKRLQQSLNFETSDHLNVLGHVLGDVIFFGSPSKANLEQYPRAGECLRLHIGDHVITILKHRFGGTGAKLSFDGLKVKVEVRFETMVVSDRTISDEDTTATPAERRFRRLFQTPTMIASFPCGNSRPTSPVLSLDGSEEDGGEDHASDDDLELLGLQSFQYSHQTHHVLTVKVRTTDECGECEELVYCEAKEEEDQEKQGDTFDSAYHGHSSRFNTVDAVEKLRSLMLTEQT